MKITIDRSLLENATETLEGMANANWRNWDVPASPEEFERWVKSHANFMALALREALAQPFDACSKSPNGEHSESWYANNDCDFCKTGAADAPLYYANSAFPSAAQPQQEPVPPELFAQQVAAAMRFADAPLSHDQFVTLVLYLKARSDCGTDNTNGNRPAPEGETR